MSPRPTHPTYRLELELLPRDDDPDRRLARALKCLLRSFGLRCRHVALIQPTPEETHDRDT
jgi:hypothetical protein